MKAHDVRHLKPCSWCRDLGDSRRMVRATVKRCELDGEHLLHPSCAYYILKNNILKLPQAERRKFRICDVPPSTMRRLLEANNAP